MITGKGWSQKETVLACKAYCSASEDPRLGSGKKKDLFLSQVFNFYNKLLQKLRSENPTFQYADRTGEAIVHRLKKVKVRVSQIRGNH